MNTPKSNDSLFVCLSLLTGLLVYRLWQDYNYGDGWQVLTSLAALLLCSVVYTVIKEQPQVYGTEEEAEVEAVDGVEIVETLEETEDEGWTEAVSERIWKRLQEHMTKPVDTGVKPYQTSTGRMFTRDVATQLFPSETLDASTMSLEESKENFERLLTLPFHRYQAFTWYAYDASHMSVQAFDHKYSMVAKGSPRWLTTDNPGAMSRRILAGEITARDMGLLICAIKGRIELAVAFTRKNDPYHSAHPFSYEVPPKWEVDGD